MGLAWIGDGEGNAAGGICDKYNDYNNGKVRSYNTGVVTMKLYGRFTPPRISEITFAHELGHGFGSEVSFRVFLVFSHEKNLNAKCQLFSRKKKSWEVKTFKKLYC